jgi:uncharacterized membrane protein YbhN (UPF0104 family)
MNRNIQRFLKLFLPYLFLAVIIVVGAIYIVKNIDQFRQIKIISWWWMVALLISFLGQAFASALIFRKLLGIFHIRLGLLEAVGLVYLTGVGNFLLPYVGGIGLRATYLKKKYGFSLSYFASTVVGNAVLTVAINALLGLIMTLYLYIEKNIFYPWIIVIFLCFLVLPVIVLLSPVVGFKSKNLVVRKINQVWEGWGIISRRFGDVAVLAAFSLLTSLLGISILYCSFRAVSEEITIINAAVVASMTALSALVHVTPAGFGITELVIVFTSRALGQLSIISVSVALIIRAVSMIIVFTGGGISSYILSRRLINEHSDQR